MSLSSSHNTPSVLPSYLSMEAHNSEQPHDPISTFPSKPDNATTAVPHIDDSLRRAHRLRRRDQPTTPSTTRKKTKKTKIVKEASFDHKADDEDEDDEKKEEDREEIERKIEALQRIVPGGESLGMDKLFDETAGYIMALQCQIKGLRALSSFFERLEKEKSKLGG